MWAAGEGEAPAPKAKPEDWSVDVSKMWDESLRRKIVENITLFEDRVDFVLLVEENLPKSVERYYDETMEGNPDYTPEQAWGTAWSRYCAYKKSDSPRCHQKTYFGKKPKDD
jgi:hypothetical protein